MSAVPPLRKPLLVPSATRAGKAPQDDLSTGSSLSRAGRWPSLCGTCRVMACPFPRGLEARMLRAHALVPAIAIVFAMTNPALAADFYAGKSIELVVGSDVGGGYDIYTRTIARHIAR